MSHSHEPTMIVDNVIALAKTAEVFIVPTILSTVIEERGGYLTKGLQDVFPEQKPINRTLINAWEDLNVSNGVKKSRRHAARRNHIPTSDKARITQGAVPPSNPGEPTYE